MIIISNNNNNTNSNEIKNKIDKNIERKKKIYSKWFGLKG